MIHIRKSKDRGHFNFGWLDTYHSFSFGDYHDPAHMGFRTLRVINEDVIEPGQGFPLHGHRDMEIVTYILKGELEHRDSLGNIGKIKRGELQRMTAGTGIRHSEYNASATEPCHLLQIWILPEAKNLEPGYEQKVIPFTGDPLKLIAAPASVHAPLKINQDAKVFVGHLKSQQALSLHLEKDRHTWIQVASGKMLINDDKIEDGDGVAVSNEDHIHLNSISDCEFILFDLN